MFTNSIYFIFRGIFSNHPYFLVTNWCPPIFFLYTRPKEFSQIKCLSWTFEITSQLYSKNQCFGSASFWFADPLPGIRIRFQIRIRPKTEQIPIFFSEFFLYNAHYDAFFCCNPGAYYSRILNKISDFFKSGKMIRIRNPDPNHC